MGRIWPDMLKNQELIYVTFSRKFLLLDYLTWSRIEESGQQKCNLEKVKNINLKSFCSVYSP